MDGSMTAKQFGKRWQAPLAAGLLALTAAAPAFSLPETRMVVTLPADWQGDASGRLLVFAKPVKPGDTDADKAEVDTSAFDPQAVSVAARDVASFGADHAVQIDTQETAFPAGFATLSPGDYRVQAVLDRNGDYNYGGRGAGDLVSKVVTIHWPEPAPATSRWSRRCPTPRSGTSRAPRRKRRPTSPPHARTCTRCCSKAPRSPLSGAARSPSRPGY